MHQIKSISLLFVLLNCITASAQKHKFNHLGGVWNSGDSISIFIDNYNSSSPSFLFYKSKIGNFDIIVKGDTIRFRKVNIGPYTDTIWWDNYHDFKIISSSDSSMHIIPISDLAKHKFNNIDTIKLRKQDYFYNHSLVFEKLFYKHPSSSGPVSISYFYIDSNFNYSYQNVLYPNQYNDDPTIEFNTSDSVIKEKFTGQLHDTTISELIYLLKTCGISSDKFVERSFLDTIYSPNHINNILFYFNNKHKTFNLKSNNESYEISRLFKFLETLIFFKL